MKFTRRALLLSALPSYSVGSYRYAICNETFAGRPFAGTCAGAKSAGFQGLEIAPSTLKDSPAECRRMMKDSGIAYVGLHSLMTGPPGLHLTTPDETVRTRSWNYFRTLIDLSAELSDGRPSVMVLGSGKQRGATDGSTVVEARNRLRDGLALMVQYARERTVQVLLEPLSPEFTNVVNTLAEAVAITKEIGDAAVRTMFDTHNTVAETEPHDALIRRYAAEIQHVHINEMDGRHPGTGAYNFRRVLRALRDNRYTGWVSLEVFQFQPSGEQIARETMAYLRSIDPELVQQPERKR
jgi:D-psicose/D-tagatose/L-ribulose 3-epimerase